MTQEEEFRAEVERLRDALFDEFFELWKQAASVLVLITELKTLKLPEPPKDSNL